MRRLQIKNEIMKIAAVAIFLLSAVVAQAQNTTTVTGTIVDETGEPMIGATVRIPGGKGGTVTDIDGNYSLDVPAGTKMLQIDYVGYKTQLVNIKGGKASIAMNPDSQVMEEMVVIGYGAVKKGDVTNAVAQVKGDDLADRPVANIASALQGELAGVDIQTTDASPGAKVQVKVRGATSINEGDSSNPLFVVDGVPMDDEFDLSNLNPQDIESIEVLKDASSSAIYGSRGANGVIIVTSKKGSDDGKISVTASANFALATAERYIPVMSGDQWIDYRSQINKEKYVGAYPSAGATTEDSWVEQVIIARGGAGMTSVNDKRWSMPDHGGLSTVNWQKAMTHRALSQTYNLSITQGNKKNNYRASVSYVNQDGIVRNTGFKRLTTKLSGRTTLFDKLQIGLDVAPQFAVTKGGRVDGSDNSMMGALTMVPVVESSSGLQTGAEPYSVYPYAGTAVSPVARMEQQTYRDEQIRIQTSGFAKYEITKDLNAEVLGSWIFNNRDIKKFEPSSVRPSWDSQREGYSTNSMWQGNRLHKYLLQATATYDKTWDKHHLNAVAGWSMESTQNATEYDLRATQFPNNIIMGWTLNDVTPTRFTTTYKTDDHMVSYFARAEYGYDSRYLLNASLRRDGSSRFGSNRKWGTFPAVSAAWRVSNEHFWKKEWLVNQAKLRVSYGSNGYNSIRNNAADGLMATSWMNDNRNSYYSTNGSVVTGYVPARTANPDLGWQKTNSWNFGADVSLFNNRISFAADYYIKTISDMLYEMLMPSVIGYERGYKNIGNIRTKGVELELKTENLTGKLKWTTKFSLGYSDNEVTSLGDNDAIMCGYNNETQIIEVGHPVGEYYLYIADGVYMNEEDLAKYPTYSGAQVGMVRYRDVNGDGVIDENDRTYCGKPQASWTYGMTNSFKYKNWDASFLITAQTGGRIWQGLGRAIDMQGQGLNFNRLDRWADMWLSEENPGNGSIPRAEGVANENGWYSTRWLYSTDFVRLKNITIGYRWRLPKKYALKVLRFTASCENALLFTKYKNGFSPEVRTGSSQTAVYDYGAYPTPRTFSLGISAQF